MHIIPQVADSLQAVLVDSADSAGRETGFIQRERKLSGSLFVQTVVFSWLANSEATLSEMSQTAAAIGLDITAQSIEERFTQQAADTLLATLDAAVEQMIGKQPAAIALLGRFNGVYLHDSSWIQLPDDLADYFAGCGGRTERSCQATMKLHLRWNILGGEIEHLSLSDGRTNDKSDSIELSDLPQGSLRIADLGYFCIRELSQLSANGVFWLSKLQVNTAVFDESANPLDLLHWLDRQTESQLEREILIGAKALMPCRLLVQRVSQEEANRRRRRIRKEAKSKGRTASKRRLQLAGYNISITNVPPEMLSVDEAMVVYRVRWQIELVFKLFKSHGGLDKWRSEKKWRIVCEIYGKLIAMVVQHWLLLCSGFTCLFHSLVKATKAVKKQALSIASAVGKRVNQKLIETLETVGATLTAGAKIYKRNHRPTTYQSLVAAAASLPSSL